MTYPTREQLEEYIRNNKLDTDESYPRSDWWKFKQQRDEYKHQRDELIKDIAKLRERNAALEEKAQAFDEIREESNWASDAEEYVINVEHIIEELERGE
ncbi:hypothetical protein [Staphylococcus warneri]|uniref:hypothetical protein n=1 Tax=Staphylococcus warneri TaxID=1292 RepID=UPI000D1D1EC9|nr:hypothetical protein [Staphylococcus warneri]PTI07184.1 hypothetical protein BU088_05625 [Staphylococcus warneri]PTI34201.1 hypothetical protein BU078_00930 [Staphylococcus warneri]RIN22399.1 hypothetical protein BU089_01650 [Staphylococcus warneri]